LQNLLKETLLEHKMNASELPTDLEKWKAFIESMDVFCKDREQERLLAEKPLATSSQEQIEMIASSQKAALEIMAGDFAHEINNPLAIIAMTVQKLKILNSRDTISQPDLLRDLDKIEGTVERISTIIKALRAFSKQEETGFTQKGDLRRRLNETLPICSKK